MLSVQGCRDFEDGPNGFAQAVVRDAELVGQLPDQVEPSAVATLCVGLTDLRVPVAAVQDLDLE